MTAAAAGVSSPRGFRALRFEVGAEDAERWSDALLEAGALSVDLADAGADTADESPLYGEPGVPRDALWPTARVEALFAADADVDAAMRDAAQALGVPAPHCTRADVAEQDWVRETQRQFTPVEVDAGFFIVPSWCAPPDGAAVTLTLDPGLAFGTGSHPTTLLCLRWLREHDVAGTRLLDYGCGSGILAIAAAKLGAADVCGVDVDLQAMVASRDNARANGATATFLTPDAMPEGTWDIVVANILANPLIVLAPLLASRVRAGGQLALSGILDTQHDAVIDAYARWFTLAPWRRADGWVLLHGVRREAPRETGKP